MTFEFVLIAIVILGFGLVTFLLIRNRRPDETAGQPLIMLQNQIAEITRSLDQRLGESTKVMQSQYGEMSKVMQGQYGETAKLTRDVTEKLVKLEETNRQVVDVTDQLKKLQDVLNNPKQRGILGEYYLETVLKNVLPPGSFEMQYAFKSGVIVDAVVFVDKRIVPIDSKFSLENYNRMLEAGDAETKKRFESAFVSDLKKRIDETSKYIKPEENTMDFAFMFIPSESVYYDLLINKVGSGAEDTNLLQYAGQKRVIIVSPTSFLAYLQTVLQGLRNQLISEQTRDIIKQVENLGRHLLSFDDYMQKLGKNLGTSIGMYNSTYKEFAKVDRDVLKITGKALEIEPVILAKPEMIEADD